MCNKGDKQLLVLPPWVDECRKNRNISVDSCCVEVLRHLWKNVVPTLGHCCGHGERKPSLVLESNFSLAGIARVEKLISDVDSRKWVLYQWKLTKVGGWRNKILRLITWFKEI